MKCLPIFLAFWPSVGFGKLSQSTNAAARRLEDENGNSYAYLNDLSSYHARFGKCVRVKIPNDDDGEGNSYFYNNRYHAQFVPYASFLLCEAGNGDNCGSCDYSTHYATDLQTFLEANIGFVQNYCGSCAAQCGRRRLEDEEGENAANYGLDCDDCTNQCALILAGRDGTDETNYLECQQAYQDDDGIVYYSGPQCSADGNIVIGLFYDDECTVKTSNTYDLGFSFNTFETVEEMCVDCSLDDTCGDLYGESYHCKSGRAYNGADEDIPVCKTYKKASTEWTYATKKKSYVTPIVWSVLGLALVSGFFFLSYTYYVRHNAPKVPLASLDNDNTSPGQMETKPSTDLPPVT